MKTLNFEGLERDYELFLDISKDMSASAQVRQWAALWVNKLHDFLQKSLSR
jgi:hypothetical protein